jgi:hypothetical protein
MTLDWEDGGGDYDIIADSGSDIHPVQLQIEKTKNGSFWAYANGVMLSHSTDIEGVKKVCQAHHDKWYGDELQVAQVPENMTFNANRMMDNAATAAQHRPLMDDPVVQGAVLRSVKQYLELNWACTTDDLIKGLERHTNFTS